MKKTGKRVIAMLLCLATIFSLVACGVSGGSDTEATAAQSGAEKPGEATAVVEENISYKKHVVVASATLVSKTDPMTTNDAESKLSYALTHDTLVVYNQETKAYDPRLCESYEVSPDGTVYTFHLRENATYSNGVACTSEDVAFTLERAKDFSSVSSRVSMVVNVECIDAHTVVITLNGPDNTFLSCMSNNHLSILSKQNVEEMGAEGAAIGTGAWVVDELVVDQYVTYKHNENYWGETPVTQVLEFRKMTENSARVIALQNGEIDVCLDVSAIDAEFVREDDNLELVEIDTTTMVKVDMNLSGYNEALTDIRVRQALQYATDKEELMLGIDALGSQAEQPVPSSMFGYDESVTTYSYDLEKAQQLMAEAGYADGLDLTVIYEIKFKSIFEILQQQWAKIGVNLTTATNDSALFKESRKNGTFDLVIGIFNWSETCTGMTNNFRSNGFANFIHLGGDDLDKLIDKAKVETDYDTMVAYCVEIADYAMQTAATMPLYVQRNLIGQNANASGAVYYTNGKHEFTYLKVAE